MIGVKKPLIHRQNVIFGCLLFAVVKLATRIIERQMGLAMANILDPLSGENAQPLGMLMEMIFILLFLSGTIYS